MGKCTVTIKGANHHHLMPVGSEFPTESRPSFEGDTESVSRLAKKMKFSISKDDIEVKSNIKLDPAKSLCMHILNIINIQKMQKKIRFCRPDTLEYPLKAANRSASNH